MLEHEYRKKRKQQDAAAAWSVRILFGIFALFVWSGVIAVWKFIGHDGYIIAAVIIPLSLLGLMLTMASLTATRRSAREFADAALSLIYFWG